MPTSETISKVEILYKAFQENPTRLTYSTSKLQKQYDVTEEEVKEAKLLYKLNPLDFTVSQAMCIIKTDYEDSLWYSTCSVNNPDKTNYKKSFMTKILNDTNTEGWEVKQKWVKGPEGSQLMVKKEQETDYKKEFKEFINSYKPKTFNSQSVKSGKKLAVVCGFDLHLGKIAFHKYTGCTDGLTQQREYKEEFNKLIDFVKTQDVEHIYLPIGNDLFNVDDTRLTTTRGTPQDNTKDLHGMFQLGLELMTTTIDALNQIAPVTVILVPGNHATNTETYLALSLESIYRDNSRVYVDHRPIPRKYYGWYNNLIGFAHGELPLKKYAELLPYEAKEFFSSCDHIEMLVGDKHIEETLKNHVVDGDGITIRRLAALTKTDVWHYQSGYSLSKRRSYVLIYDKFSGLEIQYTNSANSTN